MHGGRSKQRLNVFKQIFSKCEEFHSGHPGRDWKDNKPSLWERVRNKIGRPVDRYQVNLRLLNYLKKNKFDVIWIEKINVLKAATLRLIKEANLNAKIVFFSEDDMFNKTNSSVYFREGIHLYDYLFTTKSYNCNKRELPALGAKNVIFIGKSYDEELHKPINFKKKSEDVREGTDVGFIGTFEAQRARFMYSLASRGIKVVVWGPDWEKCGLKNPNFIINKKPLFDREYVRAICLTKINLCFLRKENRDLQTDRSVEIPACGAFMLAERTSEHLELFEEGVEAEYFDSVASCEKKIKYYLENDQARKAIAANGRNRCLNSGYSHKHRLMNMLEQVL